MSQDSDRNQGVVGGDGRDGCGQGGEEDEVRG